MPTIIAGAFPHMPIVDTSALSQRWGLKQVGLTISSLLYDSARQALYVGCFSHDTFRRNLLYFPIGENGVPFEPLVFPDHPVPLPENAATSRVWSLCLSHRKDMLYLGLVVELDVNSKKPVDKSVLKPVVVYDLDPKGVPVYSAKSPRSYGVKPQFFSQALALHPTKPRLYTIGRGLWSVAVFSLDPHSGEPIDNPRFAEIPFGGTCLGFMDDSRTLAISGYASYSGPSALVTVRLDDQGNPSSDAGDLRIHPLPAADTVDVVTGGATGFASLAIGPKAVYYKRIDGGLGYCLQNLNGTFSDYTINYERKIQAVSGPYEAQASSGPSAVNSLLVAAEHNFIDAVDGTKRPDGFVVARLSLDQKGVPGNFPEAVDVKFRQRCTLLSAIPSPAIVVSPMDVFLGNTVSDLWIQFSITPPAGDKGLQAQPELAEAAVTLKVAGRVAWETGRQNKLKIDGTLSKLVELDPYLQGRSEIALAYVVLSDLVWRPHPLGQGPEQVTQPQVETADPLGCGLTTPPPTPPVPNVTVKFEVYQNPGSNRRLVRSTTCSIQGTTACLLLPCYGLDDPASLASRIQTSSERYQFYRSLAEEASRSAGFSGHPERTIVNGALEGLGDASPDALEAGLDAMKLLGSNSVAVLGASFSDLPRETIAEAILRKIGSSWWSLGDNPLYFTFHPPVNSSGALKDWVCKEFVRVVAYALRLPLDSIRASQIQEETAWYYPKEINRLVKPQHPEDEDGLACFQRYLKTTKLAPSAFKVGAASYQELKPINLHEGTAPPELAAPGPSLLQAPIEKRRLWYWTTRFFTENASQAFALATAKLRQAFPSDRQIFVNLGINYLHRFICPSPLHDFPNNTDVSVDTANGAPDVFDVARNKGGTCLWTEEFGYDGQQGVSFYADLLRCAAREGGLGFGAYIKGTHIGSAPEAIPDGASYRVMALAGRGATALEIYQFGSLLEQDSPWSDLFVAYAPVARAMALLGHSESLLGGSGTARQGTVALLFPQTSQVWDPYDPKSDPSLDGWYYFHYWIELVGLHYAHAHCQFPLDIVDEVAVHQGELDSRGYKILYVSAPNLPQEVQEIILEWVNRGGTLVLLPGACNGDRYNDPITLLHEAAGVLPTPVPRLAVPYGDLLRLQPEQAIRSANPLFRPASVSTRLQWVPLKRAPSAKGLVLAVFPPGGEPALVMNDVGKNGGRILSFGFWPGTAYLVSQTPYDWKNDIPARLPQEWDPAFRDVATMATRLAGAGKHAEVTFPLDGGKGVPIPGVELLVLDTLDGIMVTLLAWLGPIGRPFQLRVLKRLPSIPGRPQAPVTATAVKYGPLKHLEVLDDGHSFTVTLPRLESVDVVVFRGGV